MLEFLATIGGALYGLDKSFKPFTYFNNMLPIFAAAIVGGIGNPFGAFLGGYVIAFSVNTPHLCHIKNSLCIFYQKVWSQIV